MPQTFVRLLIEPVRSPVIMTMHHRLVTAVVLLACLTGLAQERPESQPAELPGMKEAFDLLDQLGTPDTTGRRFVEVKWARKGRFEPESVFGFLMDEGDATFTVWLVDLELKRFRKDRGAKYIDADLEAEAQRTLERASEQERPIDSMPIGAWSRLISLAHELSRRGADRLARSCCGMASRLRSGWSGGPLPAAIREELETAWIWRAMLECGDPDVERSDLLDGFRRYLKAFPEARFRDAARDMAHELERMVEEDTRHRAGNRARGSMTEAEKIEELIYQLREQNGHQWMVPGHASTFGEPGDAASQLVAMGRAAVPRLIEAIGDRRPTRTVGFWRHFVFSHYVLRVGDCAVEILEQIAGRRFWHERSTHSYVLKDGLENEVRAEVMEWWNEVRPKAPETQPAETRPTSR